MSLLNIACHPPPELGSPVKINTSEQEGHSCNEVRGLGRLLKEVEVDESLSPLFSPRQGSLMLDT